MKTKKLIIAGPCAAESEEQIDASIVEVKKRSIDFMRVNLWKPRTKPGFQGLGEQGLPLLARVVRAGVHPALEVILKHHAELAIQTVLRANPKAKILLWIGSRNQNHYLQQEIAGVVAKYPENALLMLKNQPWSSEEHFLGIAEHALAGGIAKENLLLCDRGFSPTGPNPLQLRNIPDFAMSMRIKRKLGVRMLFDPSHTGGSVSNVFLMAQEAAKYAYNGLVVEVHPDPKNARTDQKQQLTWEQFDELQK